MSLPGTFKKLCVVASGATVAAFAVSYTEQLYKMNYQVDETDALTIRRTRIAYNELQKVGNSDSLLKKVLTPEVLQKLESKKTKLGATLYDIIHPGLRNTGCAIGVCAADPESYHKFAPLFDGIFEKYHGFKRGDKQPAVDLGEERISDFPPLDPKGNYIKSVKIQCARSVAGYPFSPLLSADDYFILEQKVKNALGQMEDVDLRGVYYSLDELPKRVQIELGIGESFFHSNNRSVIHANAYNDWPTGRGIYCNRSKSFLVLVNEEDHLNIISFEEGSDVGRALERLIRGLKTLEKKLTFAHDDRLGWLTSCPSNLGSGVRATIQIRLPKLSGKSNITEISDKLNLHISPAYGKSESDSYYLISNKATLGLSQYEAVKRVYDGVKELIRMEEKL